MEYYAAIDDIPNDKLNFFLKSHLALFYTREAIQPLVKRVMTQFLQNALNHICQTENIPEGTKCTSCDIQNLLHCRTKGICIIRNNQCKFHNGPDKQFKICSEGICGELLKQIETTHRFTPPWENTDSKKWCEDVLEISKCYMPKDGYRNVTNFDTIDFNGVINVMINHTGFQNEMTENLSTKDNICEKARKVGNKIRHSNIHIEESAFLEYIDVLMELLSDDKFFGDNPIAQSARDKLMQLRSSDWLIKQESEEFEHVREEVQNDTDFETRRKTMAIIQMAEQRILTCKSSLRSDLIRFYRNRHSTLPVSPVHVHSDESLIDLYVLPEMYLKGPLGKMSIGNYHELLHEKLGRLLEERELKEIYITSASGIGKTTYGKRMALAWCQAHNPLKEHVQHFDKEDLDELERFDFFFFISLKDIKDQNDYIDDIILRTIVPDLANEHKYRKDYFISEILSTYRCIIFLDGLDEYLKKETTSEVPKRKVRDTCTYITTTRPWKLESIQLISTQIDRKVEISGLSSQSADKLIDLVTRKLNDKYEREMNPNDCKAELERRNLEGFKSVPIILLQIICLWYAKKPLGRSQCEVYCNMLELLFEIAKQKDIISNSGNDMCKKKLPKCFDKNIYCQQNRGLLISLGELSFEALFKDCGVNSPYTISESTIQRCTISDQQINFCQAVGLLTQVKGSDPIMKQENTYSFLHQTFQEFLAGLYISTSGLKTDKILSDICHSVADIVDKSTIFVVMCGLCPDISSSLSKHVAEIQANDPTVQKYLEGIDNDENSSLKRLQTVTFDCLQESQDNGHRSLKMNIRCAFIASNFQVKGQKGHHIRHLKHILADQSNSLKAIDISKPKASFMNELQLEQTNAKFGKISVQECELTGLVQVLIKKSYITLTCLQLRSVSCTCTTDALTAIGECQNLRNISFWNIKLDHASFQEFTKLLTAKNKMKEIELKSIECIRNDQQTEKCEGHIIDLGTHRELNKIIIFDTHVQLQSLSKKSLSTCALRYLPNKEDLASILFLLENSSELQQLICTDLSESAELNQILPSLEMLKHLEVEFSADDDDSRENSIEISKSMKCLETLKLRHMRMTNESFGHFFEDILQLQQEVIVNIQEVSFDTTENFNNARKEIEDCPHSELDDTKTNEKALVFSTKERRVKTVHAAVVENTNYHETIGISYFAALGMVVLGIIVLYHAMKNKFKKR